MTNIQADLFAEEGAERNRLSAEAAAALRRRLEETLARMATLDRFPWSDPLDATHEENRFQRGVELLGDGGSDLWARFDAEMDRLYAAQDEGYQTVT